MSLPVYILEFLYLTNVALLAVYGINALVLAGLRRWQHTPIQIIDPAPDNDWPQVTVQLPIYNERYVAERLIESVAALDYPRNRLHIQVLDDSTDITQDIVSQLVSFQQSNGINIEHIQRNNRRGYKYRVRMCQQPGLPHVAGFPGREPQWLAGKSVRSNLCHRYC